MLSENHYTDLEREASDVERFQHEQTSYIADMLPRKHQILCIDNSGAPTITGKPNNRNFADLPPRLQELFLAAQKGKSRQGGTAPLFRSMLGYEPGDDRFCVWQPYTGHGVEFTNDLSRFIAIVATGSGAMATEYGETPWMQQLEVVLDEREQRRIPALFVCFTHQLEAQRNGGDVKWIESPEGKNVREFGISTVQAAQGKNSSTFFSQLPDELVMPASHSQHVVQIPSTGMVTYSNDVSRAQAIAYDNSNLWTIQNHPEVLASTLTSILMLRHETIGEEMNQAGEKLADRHFRAGSVEALRDRIVGSVDVIKETRESVFRAFQAQVVDCLRRSK